MSVYSWGSGATGVLAQAPRSFDDCATPIRAPPLDLLPCHRASWATSGRHALLALESGSAGGDGEAPGSGQCELWAWGDDEYGQCGGGGFRGDESTPRSNSREQCATADGTAASSADNIAKFSSIPVRMSWRTRIRRIACGWWHSALITDSGALWTWGCGQQSQLGHGDSINRSQPTLVSLDHLLADASAEQQCAGLAVADVSLGWTHSLALLADGRVIVFGTNQAGQLGTLDEKTRPIPAWLPLSVETTDNDGALVDTKFAAVSAGWKHSAFLSRNGRVFVCGSNQRGQCGRAVASSARATGAGSSASASASVNAASGNAAESPSLQRSNRPLPITFDCQLPAGPVCIRALSSGWHHLLFLDCEGEVWSLGRNDFGQCGLGHVESPVTRPQRVSLPTSLDDSGRASAVRCGSEHSVIITDRGAICVFGWNEHGNLGVGDAVNRSAPVWVPHPSAAGLLRVRTSHSRRASDTASSSESEPEPCLAVGGAAMLVVAESDSE